MNIRKKIYIENKPIVPEIITEISNLIKNHKLVSFNIYRLDQNQFEKLQFFMFSHKIYWSDSGETIIHRNNYDLMYIRYDSKMLFTSRQSIDFLRSEKEYIHLDSDKVKKLVEVL